jgi:O-antigen/teichoic acid export membrane protein
VVAAGAAGTLLPLVVGRSRLREAVRSGSGAPFRLSKAAAFAGPTALIAGADQLFVNGGPLLVIAAGGVGASRSAGVVFAATMLVRAPVYVFQGLAAALLPNLTRMHATADGARFRRAVINTVLFLLGCGAVIAAAMAVAGPASMQVLYGGEFHAARIDLVILGLGTGFYLAASTVSQALLAIDHATRAAAAWTLSAASFVALYTVLPGGDLARVSAAFTGATIICLVLLASMLLAQVRK